MAMSRSPVILGIDVSKDWLDVCQHGSDKIERIDNHCRAIKSLFKRYPSAAIAVEATNTYHEAVVELARAQGHTVYLVSGYQLKHYAHSLGQRMRTDQVDAKLLARLLAHEIDELRPYEPRSKQQVQLRRLLCRRARLVTMQQQLRQSLKGLGLSPSLKSLVNRLQGVITVMDKRLMALAHELEWQSDLVRLQSIPGVGPLTALALLEAHRSGSFRHRDPFIAFLGLDVRTKDSGKSKGRRKLTKQGNPEFRRLLYNAAMAGTQRGRYFHPAYVALQARMTKTQALVVLCRKIARIAFGLLKNQQCFDPQLHKAAGAF